MIQYIDDDTDISYLKDISELDDDNDVAQVPTTRPPLASLDEPGLTITTIINNDDYDEQ